MLISYDIFFILRFILGKYYIRGKLREGKKLCYSQIFHSHELLPHSIFLRVSKSTVHCGIAKFFSRNARQVLFTKHFSCVSFHVYGTQVHSLLGTSSLASRLTTMSLDIVNCTVDAGCYVFSCRSPLLSTK